VSEFCVRAACVEDAPCLAAAERETARTPGLLRSTPEELSDEAFAARIEQLESPGLRGRYLVAVDAQGSLVGHALLDPMPLIQCAHVFRLTIVVHPGHTSRGVGRVLMNALHAWASEHERLEKIELLVRSTNARAIRLYESCGFVAEGRLRRVIKLQSGDYVDDIAMAWHRSER
jgi:RimJ/RimL family protein N-acetyltransferase